MARKTRKGYFVDGEFVVAGSDADQQYRNELKGTDALSRTELKDASAQLQALGEQLMTLKADLFDGLSMPEKLRDAISDAKRITSLEALRRQKQFIGKLMHRLDPQQLDAVNSALLLQHRQSAEDILLQHRAEEWRDALIADEGRLTEWLKEFPATDGQQLRGLIRQARKDAREIDAAARSSAERRPGNALRKSRAYRQIFSVLLGQLNSSVDNQS
ncbi:MAG: ribosome biogenesis factor YjgA [Gammaproteobacteria bacterium]